MTVQPSAQSSGIAAAQISRCRVAAGSASAWAAPSTSPVSGAHQGEVGERRADSRRSWRRAAARVPCRRAVAGIQRTRVEPAAAEQGLARADDRAGDHAAEQGGERAVDPAGDGSPGEPAIGKDRKPTVQSSQGQ